MRCLIHLSYFLKNPELSALIYAKFDSGIAELLIYETEAVSHIDLQMCLTLEVFIDFAEG